MSYDDGDYHRPALNAARPWAGRRGAAGRELMPGGIEGLQSAR